MSTFTCASCGEEFDRPARPGEADGTVCDDCYVKIIRWARATGRLPARETPETGPAGP